MSTAINLSSRLPRQISYRRKRYIIFCLGLLFLFVFRQLLHTCYQVIVTPIIWTSETSQNLYISERRDAFDITFQAYPKNVTAESSVTTSPFRMPSDKELKVPNIFHHIVLGMEPKESWLHARQTCIDYHPDYKFYYWNDEKAVAFLKKEYPEEVDMWLNYRYPIQKADSLRYFVMLKYGGIFLDMDLQCERSLKPLQQFEIVAPAAHPMGVSNGFFMAAPNHPFLKRLVANLKVFNRHWVFLPYPTVMLSTGCYYMSAIHASHPDRSNLRVLWGPNHLHRLSGNVTTPLFKHLGSSSWHSYDAAFFNFIGKPSKWPQYASEWWHRKSPVVEQAERAASGFSWGMFFCCVIGLGVGLYTGRQMSAKAKKARRRKISFGTSRPRSMWAKYRSDWSKVSQTES